MHHASRVRGRQPLGKLPGDARFTNVYFNMSHGEPEKRGPWNQGEQWQFVERVSLGTPYLNWNLGIDGIARDVAKGHCWR